MRFQTSRLLIRPVQISDTESIFAYRSDALVNQFQGWIPKSRDEVHSWIEKNPAVPDRSGTWFQWAMIAMETDLLIGDLGVHFKDEKQCEIGCTLNEQFQGKGFATEACTRILQYLFADRNKHRITASVDPLNSASVSLLDRLGFRKEAHFKESLYIHGRWVDDVIYALLQREWNARDQKLQS